MNVRMKGWKRDFSKNLGASGLSQRGLWRAIDFGVTIPDHNHDNYSDPAPT